MDIESRILSAYLGVGVVLFLAVAAIYWDATALMISVVCAITSWLMIAMSPRD